MSETLKRGGHSFGTVDQRSHKLVFTAPDTQLFITGVSGVGKSTLAPHIAAAIEGCTIQPMDIMRLVAAQREEAKPENERNPFITRGSCDSYTLIGDGSYSDRTLIQGFNANAEVVTSVIDGIVPNLSTQGSAHVLFEGVQLTPRLVEPHLQQSPTSRLIIVTADSDTLERNTRARYEDPELRERYSTRKLLLLQDEIIEQSRIHTPNKTIYVKAGGEATDITSFVLDQLSYAQVIAPKELDTRA